MRSNGLGQSSSVGRENRFDLTGHSSVVRQIRRQIQRVARTNFTVIIEGETGTGKELIARLIHDQSYRRGQPFVAIDCGAIPENLVESELFGYVKGAFTGADSRKAGYFDAAKGGTLFLDEIANLSLAMQTKFLRSLQERRILPLGSERSIATDVRIIVASNVVLDHEVQAGRFRSDLFHRLNEFKIVLVALRERREDILCLAEQFLQETNTELNKSIQGFSREALNHLLTYAWPGNVRELRNTIRRAVLLSERIIELKHVRQILSSSASSTSESTSLEASRKSGHSPSECDVPASHRSLTEVLSEVSRNLPEKVPPGHGLHDVVQEMTGYLEKTLIQKVLRETRGNKSAAAKLLKIGYKTLYRKLKAYDLLS